ncbi:MAG: branched-chain amino acid ABC transporter ATP-binding protein/permease [Burkholderiales bacterium]
MNNRTGIVPLTLLAVGLILLPFVLQPFGYSYGIATEIAIFALIGLGFNLLLGYTGLLSFGHGLFFGFGAYAAALTQLHWFVGSMTLPLLAALLFTTLLGLVLGFLVLRRRGVYFSLLTLAFTVLGFYVAYRWTDFTGGENGLRGIKRATLFGVNLDDAATFYWFVGAIVLFAAWVLLRITRSPFGSVLVAIRENEQRATFVGYPVKRYKLIAFVISAVVMGLGGSLYAFLKLFVSADLVHVNFSGEIVAMTIIGGARNFLGPALGALFYILFREFLSSYTAAWQFWFGLLFMAFILFTPTGLVGLGARLLAPFRKVPEGLAAMAGRLTPAIAQTAPPFLQRPQTLNAGDTLYQANGLAKSFGDFRAVDNVSMSIRHGRLQALIGPNGAGKTTCFNLLSGAYPPDTGELVFAGTTITGAPAHQMAAKGIARSFQITSLFPDLTVRENLRLGLQASDVARFNVWRDSQHLAQVNDELATLMKFLGLEGMEQAKVADLSYGGQRLLEIGLSLTAKPRLLLLDEPLAGLAPAERERIIGLVKQLAEHMGVLLVEHDIDRVFEFADHITVMHNGAVLKTGDADAVRHDSTVQEVYLGSGRKAVMASRSGATPGEMILRLEGVNTFYGESHILHDVRLDIRGNQVTALLGRNGAGKSSTFKTIMGIVPPRSGSVTFAGHVISGKTPEQIARMGLGYVPQGRRLFAGLTVAENLRLGGLSRQAGEGVHWDQERIFSYFPRLRDKLNTKADVLSGGEQQMVAIARALSGNVKLLLLDEPFEGLSPAVVEEVFRSLDQLRAEMTILVIEHDLDLVLALADSAYVLDRGRVSHSGPAEPLLTDLTMRKKVLWEGSVR